MPSTRSRSSPSMSLTPSGPSIPRERRSSSRTPHHHRTLDEIMLEEAGKFVSVTPTKGGIRTRLGGGEPELERIQEIRDEKRQLSNKGKGKARDMTSAKIAANGGQSQNIKANGSFDNNDNDAENEGDIEEEGDVLENKIVESDTLNDTPINQINFAGDGSSSYDPPLAAPRSAWTANSSSTSSDDGSHDSSSSVSSSDSDETSNTDLEDSDSDDEEEERLEKLLEAAKLSAMKSAKPLKEEASSSIGLEHEEDVVALDDGDERKEMPIPRLLVPGLPKSGIKLIPKENIRRDENGSINDSPSQSFSDQLPKKNSGPKPLEVDDRPYERQLSKKEKQSQPKKATASELWSTIPSSRADLLPQMKRDYQALALANSLDPKRFMKGGMKTGKIPERFAIGSILEQPRHLQSTTLTREQKYRPGQLVNDIARDEVVGEYAKRKFGDLQSSKMANGRGKGWTKRRKW